MGVATKPDRQTWPPRRLSNFFQRLARDPQARDAFREGPRRLRAQSSRHLARFTLSKVSAMAHLHRHGIASKAKTIDKLIPSAPCRFREPLTRHPHCRRSRTPPTRKGIVHRAIKHRPTLSYTEAAAPSKFSILASAKLLPEHHATLRGENDAQAIPRNLLNTSPGTAVGTISYMSPEIKRAAKNSRSQRPFIPRRVSTKLTTGKMPFQGSTSASRLRQHCA